jgi:hypothetical protein
MEVDKYVNIFLVDERPGSGMIMIITVFGIRILILYTAIHG